MNEDKEKARDEFIYIASHQLRTPLTAIKWLVELLMRTEKLSKQGEVYLDRIHAATSRLSNFAEVLLNASRIERGKVVIAPAELELVGFIKEYFSESKPLAAAKGVSLRFDEHPVKLVVNTDELALRNIVQSLVYNAIDYTPQNGTIEISLEESGENFLLKILDNGMGIPEKDRRNIFEKFKRGSNATLVKSDGTGLGLYIAKQMVDMLGGEIRYESEVDKGTTFFVKLPVNSKPQSADLIK
jgi:signal transduction histidine kinase